MGTLTCLAVGKAHCKNSGLPDINNPLRKTLYRLGNLITKMTVISSPLASADIDYQQQTLTEVSRTFALTIPLLPPELEHAVGNAYLLCRIADTIEDDRQLNEHEKKSFSQQLISLVEENENGAEAAEAFAAALVARLSPQTPTTELDLVTNTPRVLGITRKFKSAQITAIQICVHKMATGMPDFQRSQSAAGLADMATLNSYCYVVAGVVGEMLTSFFCNYSPEISAQREHLEKLAFSFGQGLQLTNILKDVEIDKSRGVCWLPQDINLTMDLDLTRLEQLIAVTRYHLDNALDYALAIPTSEKEIRRFLIFPILLALLTLRKIHANHGKPEGVSIKISRRKVLISGLFIKLAAGFNLPVSLLFRQLSNSLPSI